MICFANYVEQFANKVISTQYGYALAISEM